MKKQTLQLLTPAQINALCELRGKVSDALQHIDVILNNQTADAVYSRIVGNLADKFDDMRIFANFIKSWNK